MCFRGAGRAPRPVGGVGTGGDPFTYLAGVEFRAYDFQRAVFAVHGEGRGLLPGQQRAEMGALGLQLHPHVLKSWAVGGRGLFFSVAVCMRADVLGLQMFGAENDVISSILIKSTSADGGGPGATPTTPVIAEPDVAKKKLYCSLKLDSKITHCGAGARCDGFE